MLNRLGIGKRLGFAFGLVVLLLIGAVSSAVLGFRSLGDSISELGRQKALIALNDDASSRVIQVMVYVGAAAATADPAARAGYLDLIQALRQGYRQDLQRLSGLVATPESRQQVAELEATVGVVREADNQALELAAAGQRDAAVQRFVTGACPKIPQMSAKFDELSRRRQERSDSALAAAKAQVRRTILIMAAAGLAAIAAAITLGVLITRSIARPVQGLITVLAAVAGGDLRVTAQVDGNDEIGRLGASLNQALQGLRTAMGEVTRASAAVASGATELSASAEQMSATTQEIARGGDLLRSATDTVNSALVQFLASIEQVDANVKASTGQTDLAVDATEAGARGSREAGERMTRIHEVTGQISRAVAVIQEIAQQTNLLSLNAAIEAAKAGEQGKGFAVVAEEVRKLADRSRESTVEIERLIQDTRTAVTAGMASVQETAERVTGIQDCIVKVAGQVREIGGATREQSATAGEISRRMEESAREVGQNATATHQLSATVQEISHTAADLAQISETMASAVARFRI